MPQRYTWVIASCVAVSAIANANAEERWYSILDNADAANAPPTKISGRVGFVHALDAKDEQHRGDEVAEIGDPLQKVLGIHRDQPFLSLLDLNISSMRSVTT